MRRLAAHLLKGKDRINEAGARRLRLDVAHVEDWARRKLSTSPPSDEQGEAALAAGGEGGLAGAVLGLASVRRLKDAAALLAEPEDRAARAQLPDAQAWLALRRGRRRRLGCGAAIC